MIFKTVVSYCQMTTNSTVKIADSFKLETLKFLEPKMSPVDLMPSLFGLKPICNKIINNQIQNYNYLPHLKLSILTCKFIKST